MREKCISCLNVHRGRDRSQAPHHLVCGFLSSLQHYSTANQLVNFQSQVHCPQEFVIRVYNFSSLRLPWLLPEELAQRGCGRQDPAFSCPSNPAPTTPERKRPGVTRWPATSPFPQNATFWVEVQCHLTPSHTSLEILPFFLPSLLPWSWLMSFLQMVMTASRWGPMGTPPPTLSVFTMRLM